MAFWLSIQVSSDLISLFTSVIDLRFLIINALQKVIDLLIQISDNLIFWFLCILFSYHITFELFYPLSELVKLYYKCVIVIFQALIHLIELLIFRDLLSLLTPPYFLTFLVLLNCFIPFIWKSLHLDVQLLHITIEFINEFVLFSKLVFRDLRLLIFDSCYRRVSSGILSWFERVL